MSPPFRLEAFEAGSVPGAAFAPGAARPDGVIVRGVLAPGDLARIQRRLAAGAHGIPPVPMGGRFVAWTHGRGLDLSTSLEAHCAEAAGVHRGLSRLLSGVAPRLPPGAARGGAPGVAGPAMAALLDLLGHLVGRPARVPADAAGRPYQLASLRRLPAGGCIPPHVEREQLARPPYRHLGPRLHPGEILSWFLVLQAPEAGGAVRVWDLRWSEVGPSLYQGDRTALGPALASRAHRDLHPPEGALLLFDGGVHAHEVAAVVGSRDRWTLGGFLARAAAGGHVWVWA